MNNYTILQMGMFLELYTNKKYSHDDVETGSFVEACSEALKSTILSEDEKNVLDNSKKFSGISCHEIGEERCNEIFSVVHKYCSNSEGK